MRQTANKENEMRKTVEQITQEIHNKLLNLGVGAVSDYAINDNYDAWVRIIKLSKRNEIAYAYGDKDGNDALFVLGSLGEAAEYIREQIANRVEQ
jgi:hypothetical protein